MTSEHSSSPDPTLSAGTLVLTSAGRFVEVSAALAEQFCPGDLLLAVGDNLLHCTAADLEAGRGAVGRAASAFAQMGAVSDEAIAEFFERFADALHDDATFAAIAEANQLDLASAKARGRSTTRLELTPSMRADMVSGLRGWALQPSGRDAVLESHHHEGWTVELVRAGLGVVGFVFEGRPNVFADACGVIRSGNTVAFRIGSDALQTARAIVDVALTPSLISAGLPADAATLVDSPSHGAGYAMFSDQRLALAVARGSGAAVAQLGGVASQAGVPVSLHGTGGAWILATAHGDPTLLDGAIRHSLDRKVCNTLNTLVFTAEVAERCIPAACASLETAAAARGSLAKLHATPSAQRFVPAAWWDSRTISRAEGDLLEPGCELIAPEQLGTEWEWENSPEISIHVVDSLDEGIDALNMWSPHFVASLVSENSTEQELFYARTDVPFIGNGFTRWVDGQYAFDRPELGLANWERGRLFGRGGVLSGDSVFTLRTRVTQTHADLHR